jgi:hypothetical protein
VYHEEKREECQVEGVTGGSTPRAINDADARTPLFLRFFKVSSNSRLFFSLAKLKQRFF